jgi:hypothetical protein
VWRGTDWSLLAALRVEVAAAVHGPIGELREEVLHGALTDDDVALLGSRVLSP